MRIPRDIDGSDLINALAKMGYAKTKQAGSHIKLTTKQNGEHHATIPNHSPIKMGTLNNILKDIAEHFGISKEDLIEKIF
jgi:predicted RNA binding protein YcfA (HicA-like mRNA interferase family)